MRNFNGMYWYLIQTKPNAHLIASKNLEAQDFEIFLPLISKTLKKWKKFKTTNVPLFPNYLFIGSHSKIQSWKSINSTRGVSRAVSLGANYRPINNIVIENLKYRCDANGVLKPEMNLKISDKVKIERGPFSKFICEVAHVDDEQRALVFIQFLHQKVRAKVPVCDLYKIN